MLNLAIADRSKRLDHVSLADSGEDSIKHSSRRMSMSSRCEGLRSPAKPPRRWFERIVRRYQEANDICISNVLYSSVGGAHAPTREPGGVGATTSPRDRTASA